jgi:DNA recombination protein RmuC
MEDVARVDERVRRLQTHFGQAAKDIDDILVSTSKVTKRGQKIEALEFAEGEAEPRPAKVEGAARMADSKTGQLRLRVVEDGE